MISDAENSLFKMSIQNGKSNLWFEHEKNSELGSPLAKSLIWNEVVKSGGMKGSLPKRTLPKIPTQICPPELVWK